MIDINKLENVNVLLTYQDLFDDEVTINEHLKHGADYNDLCFLSAISFYEDEENRLSEWVSDNFQKLPENRVVFGRSERLTAWKYLLSNISSLKLVNNRERCIEFFKLFLLINDRDNNRDFNVRHKFSLGFINNYRDRYIAQYYRAKKIFLSEAFVSEYGEKFYSHYGVSVHEYFHVIHAILKYYKHSKRRVDYYCSYNSLYWQFNVISLAKDYNCDMNVFSKVMECVSFDLNEGKLFSLASLYDSNNISLFRDKPFIKISPSVYIPIDGKLVEELLFNNLFYKIKEINDVRFLSDFGLYFESYIQSITESSITNLNHHKYKIIPEFKYKKGQCKSPDLILLTEYENSALVVEVKSARFLDEVVSSNNNESSLDKSLIKLKENPWKQSAKSISEIISLKENVDINENKNYYFLAVTMNDIPMSLTEYNIKDNNGNDISDFFFSMNVEAYECLLEIVSSDCRYNIFDILRAYRDNESSMSIKTYLARVKKYIAINNSNPLFDEMNQSQFDSVLFLKSIEADIVKV
ncbi:hypothetical protein [Vibrio parahaemolyticus]|uniref:hypothetical protein n=1 Tax=Vibrio parahaemolyticus TaxID=670 RepID=UPI003D9CB08F